MLHSWVLTMEMLITHVVLTLNHSSWLQFCIINGVTELKISVFKKCDLAGLFDYANNDAMDRFHVAIYIMSTLLQTSQDRLEVSQKAAYLYVMKALVDYLKHFFLTRMNKISPMFYSAMRKDMFKALHRLGNESATCGVQSASQFETFKYEKEVEVA
mmetsp:Transcript_14753/g.17603  ORF Transcript_14753/g.17603 Transcript_14753/m.17603 type:complete len:157 (+) Transcript_14753:1-471(+)